MSDQSGLKRSYAERTKEAREKALQAIDQSESRKQQVNFSTVAQEAEYPADFLYEDQEVKK